MDSRDRIAFVFLLNSKMKDDKLTHSERAKHLLRVMITSEQVRQSGMEIHLLGCIGDILLVHQQYCSYPRTDYKGTPKSNM